MPARASDLCVFDTDGVGDPLLVVVEMLGDDDEPLTQRSDRSRVRVCDVLMEDVRRAACRKERAAVEIGGQGFERFVMDEGADVEPLLARVRTSSGPVE